MQFKIWLEAEEEMSRRGALRKIGKKIAEFTGAGATIGLILAAINKTLLKPDYKKGEDVVRRFDWGFVVVKRDLGRGKHIIKIQSQSLPKTVDEVKEVFTHPDFVRKLKERFGNVKIDKIEMSTEYMQSPLVSPVWEIHLSPVL